ncbi:MAG: type II toxin-antitoxin system VapC family toxin [Magnetococcus sp. DMHC-1]|nr:type II toxin-antitoxin system VapC family toxin [Magnetococcales bacterium]
MKLKVYLETSIISYLAARPSRDIIVSAHKKITVEWWHKKRNHFDLYTSKLVIQEASAGNTEAAAKRIVFLAGLPRLTINENVMALASCLLAAKAVPQQAMDDVYHIAMAAVHGMDFLLTWNCKHIANATMRHRIEQACRTHGFEPPIMTTPEQLLEE